MSQISPYAECRYVECHVTLLVAFYGHFKKTNLRRVFVYSLRRRVRRKSTAGHLKGPARRSICQPRGRHRCGSGPPQQVSA
jgi:hypothetical protein